MGRSTTFLFAFCILSFSANAATVTWDGGGGDMLWSNAANWTGDVVPVSGDDVVLDNSVITGNYSVELPGGSYSVTINSFRMSPGGGNIITFRVPIANIANPAFSVTGTGDAVILDNGAIFFNSSGRTLAMGGTAVTVGATNFFRINNGARYVHNTASGHTNNLVSRLSTATGTENGVFEFDIPNASNTISLSDRTYGTLRLSSAANGGAVTYIGNGVNPLNVKGDMEINIGVTFRISMTANFIVQGNFSQQAASVFNIQSSMSAGGNNVVRFSGNITSSGVITETGIYQPVIELGGTTNQDISFTGSITNSVSFRINNNAGATLLSPLVLPYNLDLQNGKIRTDATNILALSDNGTVSGGSSASFIEGPMKKAGDDASFTFPVGKGSIYAPIRFDSPGLAITDEFEAEYFRSNPQNAYGTDYEAPFDHISFVEYWQLEKKIGSLAVPVSITLPVTQYSFAEVMNTTYIARHNTSDNQWKNNDASVRITGPTVPPYVTGTITGMPLNQLGIFTLATTDVFAVNPLPVRLVAFDAIKTNSGEVNLNWQVSGNNNSGYNFEIERSQNGKDFVRINLLHSPDRLSFYSVRDNQLLTGTRWYRLKITGKDASAFYSRTVIVTGNADQFINAVISPNPVTENAVLKIYSHVNTKASLIIYDATGRIIKTREAKLLTGNNNIALATGANPAGIYFLYIATTDGKQVVRFVKK